MMKQIIKKVPITGTYYADEYGEVYEYKSGVMEPCVTELLNSGYYCLDRKIYGGLKLVHRLVAYAFHGDIKSREVDHINRDKLDNRPSNLQILTPSVHLRKTTLQSGAPGLCQYRNTLTLVDKEEIVLYANKKYPIASIAYVMGLAEYVVKSYYHNARSITNKKLKKLWVEIRKDKKRMVRVLNNFRELKKLSIRTQ